MDATLTLHPIGYIRSEKQVKFDAPHQPSAEGLERSVLELLPGHSYEQALQDLAGFSRIWLVWWFHRNTTWKPLVQPPRGPVQKRGVFATRSPHRPNPLGLTAVPLIAVEGRRLILGPCDLVDGTPVFDIKPYLPYCDAFPEESSGWNEEVEREDHAPPAFSVEYSGDADVQIQWLREDWGVDFSERLEELLSRDPSPHPTRRIKQLGGERYMISCGAWRAFFTVEGTAVLVESIAPGYPRRFLEDPARERMPDKEAQLGFLACWPEEEEE